jgi:hypothetical protein
MKFQDLLRAALIGVPILIVLAAGAFWLTVSSIAASDPWGIKAAIMQADPADLGMPELERRVLDFHQGYFPECVGLTILLREPSWPAADAAVRADAVLPPAGTTICQDLQNAISDPESVNWFTYARYWHGALTLHRAVLSDHSYATLQWIAHALVAAALLGLAAAIAWRLGVWPALAVALVLAGLSDAAAVGSLPILAVSLAALFASAAAFLLVAPGLPVMWVLVAAGTAGALYNFFDFLCNPETLAALCAWAWMADRVRRGERADVLAGLAISAAVIGGYAGFWAMKWAIAVIYDLSGGDVYILNAGEFTRWGGPAVAAWFPGAAMQSIIAAAADAWWKVLAIVAVLAAVLAAGGRLLARPSFWLMLTPLVFAVALLEAKGGHTMAHTAITFRFVPVALALMLASALIIRDQMISESRKASISASA